MAGTVNDYRPHILFLHAYQGREAGIEKFVRPRP